MRSVLARWEQQEMVRGFYTWRMAAEASKNLQGHLQMAVGRFRNMALNRAWNTFVSVMRDVIYQRLVLKRGIMRMFVGKLGEYNAKLAEAQNTAQALPAEVVSDIQSTMEAYAKRDGIEGVDVVAPTSVALGSV